MNLVLTGFMASGKTSIAKAIAERSGYTLIDTDEMIERKAGMTINEIFEKYGEKRFREIEHECVAEAAAHNDAVISTGGGVVLDKSNLKALRQNGVIINLAPDFSVIQERLAAAAATRPLLQNTDIEAVRKRFEDRLPYYSDYDFQIRNANDKAPSEYADEILGVFGDVRK